MIIAFQDLSLVEKAKADQIHFTLEGEGLRVQRYHHDEKSTWIPTWHAINNVSRFAIICVMLTSKR